MLNNNIENISRVIRRTGYPLEYRVVKAFEKQGWIVISNKYYIDSFKNIPREIDLIAYKVSIKEGVNIYTTVIVSCKKSEERDWVLLSKEPDLTNPNINWWPLHVWSNNKAISYEMDKEKRNKEYYEEGISKGIKFSISKPKSDIFAFQEVKKDGNGKLANDTAIYSAVNSLLSAQTYEMKVLPERKKDQVVYQFNLLSVLDGDLYRADFKEDREFEVNKISYEQQLSRYIINRKQSFSNVTFIDESMLLDIIEDYDLLHSHNCKVFIDIKEDFFEEAIKDNNKRSVYLPDFRKKFRDKVYWSIYLDFEVSFLEKDVDIWWNKSVDSVAIMIDFDGGVSERVINDINESEEINKRVSEVLYEVYKYRGEFSITEGIPF